MATAQHGLEVLCPPGVAEGDLISITADGIAYDVRVPAGVGAGDTFHVDVITPGSTPSPPPGSD
eukprot:3828085-Prymnesium_polylepis.1